MFSFDYADHLKLPWNEEQFDPRGGRVIDTDTSIYVNGFHTPYRAPALDIGRTPFDPQGTPLEIKNTFPGLELQAASLASAMNSLHYKENSQNGSPAQQFFDGISPIVSV